MKSLFNGLLSAGMVWCIIDSKRQFDDKRGGRMLERITVDPEVHFGKPCVAGTRITVQSVLELLDEDLSFDDIIQHYYPDLTPEGIRACIQYAIALVAAEDIHLTAVPA
jgi:uncharacterized protein (DUF433 family)